MTRIFNFAREIHQTEFMSAFFQSRHKTLGNVKEKFVVDATDLS